MTYAFNYKAPGPVGAAFIKSRPASVGDLLPIEILAGPIGSGKSVCCCLRIFLHALEQPAGPDGWRKSRWGVVRNTNPMLETTTIQTWLEWFPENVFGKFNWSPPYEHHIRLPDLKVDLVVWFVPLDRPDQVKKLLSLELTGLWINEGREIPREIVIAGRSRCGRYPSLRDGTPPGWAGVIIDTNFPEEELHFLNMWSGQVSPPEWMGPAERALMFRPQGIDFFFQAPGLLPVRDSEGKVQSFDDNPAAENLRHLRPGYYRAQLSGSTIGWVLNMVCCEVTRSGTTRLIYPDFNRALHVAASKLEWRGRDARLAIGMDFARNPAVVLAQDDAGQLQVLREWIGQNIDVASFVKTTVVPELNREFPEARLQGWGDPSGGNRTGGDDSTAFTHAREGGLTLVRAASNDPDVRTRVVTRRLTALAGGRPALLVSPNCRTLIGGFEGGYRFERKKVEGTVDEFHEEPLKNIFSHIHDGLQYLVLGVDGAVGRRDPEEQRRAAQRHGGAQPNGMARVDPYALARMARRGR